MYLPLNIMSTYNVKFKKNWTLNDLLPFRQNETNFAEGKLSL